MMSGPAIPDGRSRRASARTSRHAPSAASCRTSVRPTSPVAPATSATGAELTLARSLLHVRPAVLGRGRAAVVGHGQLHVVVSGRVVGVSGVLLGRAAPVAEVPLPAHDGAVVVLALVREGADLVLAVDVEIRLKRMVRRGRRRGGIRRKGPGIARARLARYPQGGGRASRPRG